MADRFCPSCGTEVDRDARFCPTCGQTLLDEDEEAGLRGAEPPDEGEAETAAIPPAPAWPPPEDAPQEPPAEQPQAAEPAAEPAPQRPPPEPAPPPQADAPPPPGSSTAGTDLPFTLPTTLSGWLIGAGTGAAALALLPGLGNLLNVLLFLALLGITASIFLADRMPEIPNLRLATLVVIMIALGVALDRAAFTVRGVDTVFLIAMLVTAGGALLIELDRDQPVSPPGGTG